MGEYLQIKDKGMVKNYLGKPEAEMRGDLTKDLTSVSSMIEENRAKLKGKLGAVTDLVNKKIDTGKLDKTQAEGLVKEYDGKLKGAVLEARKSGEKDVESLINILDGIMTSGNPMANPEKTKPEYLPATLGKLGGKVSARNKALEEAMKP